jgi:Uma2 family endonuclease
MEDLPRRHGITVDEYYRMAETGELAPDARVELIEGEIIDMPPVGNPHMATVDRLNKLLVQGAGDRAIVRCQGAVQLGDFSMPQPDFVLLAPRVDYYSTRRAVADDVFRVIEVSDTTLSYDRGRKLALYARFGLPEFWVIDVNSRRLYLHRRPSENAYTETAILEAPSSMNLERLPGIELDLSWLLGS